MMELDLRGLASGGAVRDAAGRIDTGLIKLRGERYNIAQSRFVRFVALFERRNPGAPGPPNG